MALTQNTFPYWYQGLPVRQEHATTLKASTNLFKTAVCMQVDGVVQNVVTGSAMAALCLLIPGADGNGGIFYSARSSGVRVSQTAGGAEGIVITTGATIDIAVTFVAMTSTASGICNLIRSNGMANQYLRCKAQGTGASAPAAQAITAVPFITLLGCATAQYDNSAGVTTKTFSPPEMVFDVGTLAMTAGAPPPAVGDPLCWFDDESVVTSVRDFLALGAPLRGIEGAKCYVDLAAAF